MKKIYIIIFLLFVVFSSFGEEPECPIVGEYRITSRIGFRLKPVNNTGGEIGLHKGVDYSALPGTKIIACFTGVVVEHWPPPDGYYKGHPDFGGLLRIKDKEGLTSYGHLSKTFVKEGDFVMRGEVIGEVGTTGKSTGPHLHLERFVELNFRSAVLENYIVNF